MDQNLFAFNVEIRSLYKYQCGLELKNWKILTIVNQTTTETTIHPEKLEWWNHQTPSFVLIFLFFSYQIASLNNSLTDKLKAYCITTMHSALQTLVEHIWFLLQYATVQRRNNHNHFKEGAMGMYFVFPVIVTVIVLSQCLSCSFGQN